jgi:hypothetical protein
MNWLDITQNGFQWRIFFCLMKFQFRENCGLDDRKIAIWFPVGENGFYFPQNVSDRLWGPPVLLFSDTGGSFSRGGPLISVWCRG